MADVTVHLFVVVDMEMFSCGSDLHQTEMKATLTLLSPGGQSEGQRWRLANSVGTGKQPQDLEDSGSFHTPPKNK